MTSHLLSSLLGFEPHLGRGFGLARFFPLPGQTRMSGFAPDAAQPKRTNAAPKPVCLAAASTLSPVLPPAAVRAAAPASKGFRSGEKGRGRAPRPLAWLAALLLGTPAAADTACYWGQHDGQGTNVRIAPHTEAWAEVTIHNRLSFRARVGPCALTFDGADVAVTYDPGPYREPDVFTVTPPPGFVAVPDWLLVDDDTRATVLIWPDEYGAGM